MGRRALAGAVLAAALAFVLLTFGAAIGLSATSPWPNSGLSVKVIATLAVYPSSPTQPAKALERLDAARSRRNSKAACRPESGQRAIQALPPQMGLSPITCA